MSSVAESTQSSQLLFVGQQCQKKQCYMVDFLPFKCDHCKHSFCAEHFKPDQHSCEKFDPSKHDRVAPSCPLCNTPVAIPVGQDPNIRMEQHMDRECKVTTGKAEKGGSMPTCSRGRCGKRLFVLIRCDGCSQQFCPEHRYPTSHSCNTTPSSSTNSPSLTTSGAKLANQTSAASAAAMAAIKRGIAKSTPAKPASTIPQTAQSSRTAVKSAVPPASSAAGSSKRNNPFSKTDRCGFSSSFERETRTPTSDSSSSMSSSTPLSFELPSPSSQPVLPTNRARCNPLDSILTTSWTPPSLFGTAS